MKDDKNKLLNRPIEPDSRILSEKVITKNHYAFLFEVSSWDGIIINSVILLKDHFKEASRATIENVLSTYFEDIVHSEATFKVSGAFIFYNYKFTID